MWNKISKHKPLNHIPLNWNFSLLERFCFKALVRRKTIYWIKNFLKFYITKAINASRRSTFSYRRGLWWILNTGIWMKPNQEPNARTSHTHLLSRTSPTEAKYSHWTVTWTKVCCYCFSFLNKRWIYSNWNQCCIFSEVTEPKLTPNFKVHNLNIKPEFNWYTLVQSVSVLDRWCHWDPRARALLCV